MKKRVLIGVSAAALLLIAAPVALPRLVDWNDYRAELARRVGEITGRAVAFDGDLGLQLLPAPAFTAENVKIKAPSGFSQADMATLKRLEVRVALAPLLSGRIQVESIVADAPQVVVEIDAGGRVNWRVAQPAAGGGGASDGARIGPLAQLLSFDQIVLDGGRLELIDSRSGARETLEKIDLRVVAGSLTGPFQASGGVMLRGAPLRLEATTGRFADGTAAPVRLAITLPGGDPERLSGARFAGIVSPGGPEPRLQGELRLEGPDLRAALQPMRFAAAPSSGPRDRLSDRLARPFALRAAVEAEENRLRFDNLEVALGEARGAGTAALTLGDPADLTLSLLFNRLDLDAWLPPLGGDAADDGKPKRPAAALEPHAATAATAAAAAAAAEESPAWPEKLRAKIDLTVDAAGYAGGTIRQGRLLATMTRRGAAVERLSALLPGGTAVSATGELSQTGGAGRADFRVEASADNLRGLLGWLRTDVGAIPADRLRKAAFAGRIGGRIGGEAAQIEIADVEMSIDAASFKGALTASLRERPAFGLRLEADTFNIDAYFPAAAPPSAAGVPTAAAPAASAGGGKAAPEAWEAAVARLLGRGDVAVLAQAQELIVGGHAWRGVKLDAAAAAGALEVREATADDVSGVRLRVSGQAESFAPLKGAHLTLQAETQDAAGAAARLLPAMLAASVPPGRGALQARLAGDRDKLALETALEAAGGKLELGGDAVKPLALLGLAAGNGGRFDFAARLSHPDADALLGLAGLRAPAAPGAFDLYAKLNGDAARLNVADLKGMLGAAAVAGSGKLDRKAVRPWVEIDLQTGALDLDRALEKTAAPVTAPAQSAAAPAASARPAAADLEILRRFDGRFALTAAGLRIGGVAFDNVAAKLHLSDGILAADRFDAGLAGGRVGGRAELAAAGPKGERPPRFAAALTAEGLKPTATVLGPLALAGGVADAETDIGVVDPLAAEPLRRLSGSARVSVRGGTLRGVDLAALRDRLQRADRPQAVVEGVLRGLQGGETRVAALDASCRIDNGVAETSDARLETTAGGVGAVGRVDLADRTVDMLVTVEPDVDPPMPPLAMRLTGSLDAPTRTLDVGALQRRLLERLGGAAAEGLKPPDLPARIEDPVRDLLRSLGR